MAENKDKPGEVLAGQSISYNSAKSNTAGVKAGDPAPDTKEGRKGRGVAVGRAGGAF